MDIVKILNHFVYIKYSEILIFQTSKGTENYWFKKSDSWMKLQCSIEEGEATFGLSYQEVKKK